MSNRYRVTHAPHYIEGRLVFPDRGDASIVTLPKGVEPGRWLEPVDGKAKEGAADDQKALLEEARALGLKPHHATGPEKLKDLIAEAKAKTKEGGSDEPPPAGEDLPDA